MNQINTEITAENTVAATPRDDSRRVWLRHAGMVAGAFALAGNASRAMAQTDMAPGTMADTGTPGMAMADKEYMSIVEDKGTNPNHPEVVIPKIPKTAKPGDVDILNFALGLEYLEADFYARIVQAHQNRAYLSPRVYEVAQKLAADEASHVEAILDILGRAGATPVARPQFQYPENVFFAQLAFLDLASTFEVTGVGAYLGAAPKVQSSDALKFAASVYGSEARHVSVIRMLNGQLFSPSALELPLQMDEVLKRVAPFIIV